MANSEYKLESEYIELISLLKLLRIASTGGHAKIIVENKEVQLNGSIELRKRAKLRKGDWVQVGNSKIQII